jgi:hypothetical protein
MCRSGYVIGVELREKNNGGFENCFLSTKI